MGLPEPIIITRQMVANELIKAGINRNIADDLAYRYYKNELTQKDLAYLESNFNLKLENMETRLKSDIIAVKNELKSDIHELDNKIDNVKTELKSDIKELDNKINTVEHNLNNKIDNVKTELKADIKELDNKIDNVKTELKSDIEKVETNLNNKINIVKNELKSDIISVKNEITIVKKDMSNLEKTNKWIFGLTFTLWLTVIGGFIALIMK